MCPGQHAYVDENTWDAGVLPKKQASRPTRSRSLLHDNGLRYCGPSGDGRSGVRGRIRWVVVLLLLLRLLLLRLDLLLLVILLLILLLLRLLLLLPCF